MEKLTITNLDNKETRTFAFNPTTLSFHQSVRYKPTLQANAKGPKRDFQGGEGARLEFELLLDGTADRDVAVQEDVEWLRSLLKAEELAAKGQLDYEGKRHRPPVCEIRWGSQQYLGGRDVVATLSSLNVTYTLFSSDGTPLRARASLTFGDVAGKSKFQDPIVREALAREVYDLLRRELRVERERVGWTPREF